MQLSIGKLAALSIGLLIAVTIITTGAGLYVLQSNYRTLENRHDTEARDSVRNAAIALRHQIRFYQGILQLTAANPEVSDLLEFGDTPEISRWSQTVGGLLPGTLGTALTSPAGVVFGDPLTLRVGPACQADMRLLAQGMPIGYPRLHTDVAGLEHFDLLTAVSTATGEHSGTLFVSFHRSVLEGLLKGMTREGDRFVLLDENGSEKLSIGTTGDTPDTGSYGTQVPDTPWRLTLHRPLPPSYAHPCSGWSSQTPSSSSRSVYWSCIWFA